MTDSNYIRKRISELRIKKGVSEYKMSYDLGHSKGYIQSISSGRTLPSIPEFLYICEYLGVSPKDFFDTNQSEPILIKELIDITDALDAEDIQALILVAKRMKKS